MTTVPPRCASRRHEHVAHQFRDGRTPRLPVRYCRRAGRRALDPRRPRRPGGTPGGSARGRPGLAHRRGRRGERLGGRAGPSGWHRFGLAGPGCRRVPRAHPGGGPGGQRPGRHDARAGRCVGSHGRCRAGAVGGLGRVGRGSGGFGVRCPACAHRGACAGTQAPRGSRPARSRARRVHFGHLPGVRALLRRRGGGPVGRIGQVRPPDARAVLGLQRSRADSSAGPCRTSRCGWQRRPGPSCSCGWRCDGCFRCGAR